MGKSRARRTSKETRANSAVAWRLSNSADSSQGLLHQSTQQTRCHHALQTWSPALRIRQRPRRQIRPHPPVGRSPEKCPQLSRTLLVACLQHVVREHKTPAAQRPAVRQPVEQQRWRVIRPYLLTKTHSSRLKAFLAVCEGWVGGVAPSHEPAAESWLRKQRARGHPTWHRKGVCSILYLYLPKGKK